MRDFEVTRLFKEMVETDKSTIVQRGGARSGKSMAILQYLIYRMTTQHDAHILLTRKTFPALRLTTMKVFIDLLKEYGYYMHCDHSLSNYTLLYRPTNTFVAFLSIENPERIMSSEWNYIFMEEAIEYRYEAYMRLQTRLSSKTEGINQLIMAFNPSSALHWIKKQVVDTEEDLLEIVSNYKDNPFLSPDYIKRKLLPLKKHDKNAWMVFGEGKWGSLENIIYKGYDTVDRMNSKSGEVVYGLDFGYNVASALLKVKEVDDEYWIQERVYQTNLTNSDLIEKIKLEGVGNHVIYCDSAEPQRIEEMRRAGLNARKANKSIKDGIDFVKRKQLHITKGSVNTLKEISGYSYRKDGLDNVIDEPVKFNDHAMDAMRYGLFTHFGNKIDYRIFTGE